MDSFHTCCIPLPAEHALMFPECSSAVRQGIDVASTIKEEGDGDAEDVFTSSEVQSPVLITPSWFGKGCRKSSSSNKKRRRKSRQSR